MEEARRKKERDERVRKIKEERAQQQREEEARKAEEEANAAAVAAAKAEFGAVAAAGDGLADVKGKSAGVDQGAEKGGQGAGVKGGADLGVWAGGPKGGGSEGQSGDGESSLATFSGEDSVPPTYPPPPLDTGGEAGASLWGQGGGADAHAHVQQNGVGMARMMLPGGVESPNLTPTARGYFSPPGGWGWEGGSTRATQVCRERGEKLSVKFW